MTILSLCNNSWWVTGNSCSNLLSGVFSEFRPDTVEWTGGLLAALCQQQQKSGEVGSAVFHAPPVWHKPLSPLLCLPGCVMFFMADRLAANLALETRMDKTDERENGEVGREREGGEGGEGWRVDRGSPASLCQGFPHSHLGCVNPRLTQAHSWTLTSPLALAFPRPHSTFPSAYSSPLPSQTMNKRACLHAAEKRAARSRGETLPGDSCQQQRRAGFCVKNVRK